VGFDNGACQLLRCSRQGQLIRPGVGRTKSEPNWSLPVVPNEARFQVAYVPVAFFRKLSSAISQAAEIDVEAVKPDYWSQRL